MKKTLITMLLVLLAVPAFAETYNFKVIKCSDISVKENEDGDSIKNKYVDLLGLRLVDARKKYQSGIIPLKNGDEYIVPLVDNRPNEYQIGFTKHDGKKYNIHLYTKKNNDKLNLVVTTLSMRDIWGFAGFTASFEAAKCFEADIPKQVLEADAKAKADAEQKIIDDVNNKKKWAEGE